jgi:hypothetical protein
VERTLYGQKFGKETLCLLAACNFRKYRDENVAYWRGTRAIINLLSSAFTDMIIY